jgi:hypothetical protein
MVSPLVVTVSEVSGWGNSGATPSHPEKEKNTNIITDPLKQNIINSKIVFTIIIEKCSNFAI